MTSSVATGWQYIISERKGAIETEASYPYTSGGGTTAACRAQAGTAGATIASFESLSSDEDDMALWIEGNGPVAAAAYALPWKHYLRGVITSGDALGCFKMRTGGHCFVRK